LQGVDGFALDIVDGKDVLGGVGAQGGGFGGAEREFGGNQFFDGG